MSNEMMGHCLFIYSNRVTWLLNSSDILQSMKNVASQSECLIQRFLPMCIPWPHPTAGSPVKVTLCLSSFPGLGLISAVLQLVLLWVIDRGRSPYRRPLSTLLHTICASMGDAETGWISSGRCGAHPQWSPRHLEVSNLTYPNSLLASKSSSGIGCQRGLKGNIFFSCFINALTPKLCTVCGINANFSRWGKKFSPKLLAILLIM